MVSPELESLGPGEADSIKGMAWRARSTGSAGSVAATARGEQDDECQGGGTTESPSLMEIAGHRIET